LPYDLAVGRQVLLSQSYGVLPPTIILLQNDLGQLLPLIQKKNDSSCHSQCDAVQRHQLASLFLSSTCQLKVTNALQLQ
jgi:hypothetical protein